MAKTYNNFADIITFSRASNATVRDSDGYIKWAGHNYLTYSNEFSSWSNLTTVSFVADDATAPDGTDTAVKMTNTSTNSFVGNSFSFPQTWNFKFTVYAKYIDNQWLRLMVTSTLRAVWFDIQNGTVGTTGADIDEATIEDVGNGWYKCTIKADNAFATPQAFCVLADGDGSSTETNGASMHLWGAHVYNCQYLDMVQNPANTWTGGGSYYSTGSSAYFAPRIEHDPDGNVKGLLVEEYRENLRGSYIINFTPNNTTENQNDSGTLSPSGKNDSTLVRENSFDNLHRYFGSNVLVENPTSTYKTAHSVYAKEDSNYAKRYLIMTPTSQGVDNYAVFDLSGDGSVTQTGSTMDDAYIEKAGNGWYRCTVTTNGDASPTGSTTGIILAFSDSSTPSNFQPSYQGNGESGFWFWGYQVESIHNTSLQNYHTNIATSYIPTTGGTAYGRSADKATLNRSDLAWNNDEGTIFVEALTPQAPNGSGINMAFHIGDGTTLSRFWMGIYDTGGRVEVNFKTRDVSVVSLTDTYAEASLSFEGATFKQAFAYKEGDYAMSVNGVTANTSAGTGVLAELSTWDNITIGSYRASAHDYPWNAPIVNIKYYPRRLTDDQLQELTS